MRFILILIGGVLCLGGGIFFWLQITNPNVKKIKSCLTTTMYEIYLCPQSANYTPLQDISQSMIQTLIIGEDASFYYHNGFDWAEIRLSFLQNLHRLEFFRGGSTITQQLAKNVFLSSEKTLLRKLREAIITTNLEENLTKDEILEKYLNVVQFGEKIHGINSAAKYYFNKSPQQLNLLESVFLVYLLPNPIKYSQIFIHEELDEYSRKRFKDLLRKVFLFKKISKDQYLKALYLLDHFPWTDLEDYSTLHTSHRPVGQSHSKKKEHTYINEEDGL